MENLEFEEQKNSFGENESEEIDSNELKNLIQDEG